MQNPAKVDDILAYSWGYDQTNVDWFKVTRVTSASVELTPIGKQYTETGFMSGETTPDPETVTGHPFMKRVLTYAAQPYVVSFDYGVGIPWDGRPKYESHYA